MSLGRDRFLLVTGAVLAVVLVAGWLVVEARTGPFDHEATVHEHQLTAGGAVALRSAQDPAGTPAGCQVNQEPPLCFEAQVAVRLEIEGLPDPGPGVAYGVFLTGPTRILPVGVLAEEGDRYTIDHQQADDGEGLDELVVTLVLDPEAQAPSPLRVVAWPIDLSDGSERILGEAVATLPMTGGQVQVAQIGAFEVSTTVHARLHGLAQAPGWSYQAWLVDEDTGAATSQGTLEVDETGQGTLDARVERVVLDEQERFVVTVQPVERSPGDEPRGFPVVDLALDT